ncbi:MAG: 1-acyl-sn-glycerol-3-phosphate acyltransferase, partial [Haliea sp.]|nr:1-acyl-sn-glycerol-3-phosphate acyltransferase [Haliea sp.]
MQGEEHLWSHRPAVFVFNHQSRLMVVIASWSFAVRRDIAGVARRKSRKRARSSAGGQRNCGVRTIDRADGKERSTRCNRWRTRCARGGKSVVIAPSGHAHGITPNGALQKGAFHLAMQAGVPIASSSSTTGDVAPGRAISWHPSRHRRGGSAFAGRHQPPARGNHRRTYARGVYSSPACWSAGRAPNVEAAQNREDRQEKDRWQT